MAIRRISLTLAALAAAIFAAAGAVLFLMQPPGLPVPERGAFTIKDVTVVNPGEGRATHVDIAVTDGMIRAVTPTRPGPGVDCEGCYALPGLIDSHAHLPPKAVIGNQRLFSLLFLANGVTTIRELGSADGSVYAARDAIAAGRFPGPRVISCGLVLDGDPPVRSSNTVVRDAAEGRAEVRKAVAKGARCIKLYNTLSRDAVMGIAGEAAKTGTPLVAHMPHSISILDAPMIADIQHLTGAPVPVSVAARGREDYLNSDFANLTDARIAEVTAAALRQGTIHTPALVNEDVRRTLGDPRRFPADPQIAVLPDVWPRVWRTMWPAPNLGAEEAIYEGFLRRDRDAVRAFLKAGVKVYAGTDTLMPFVAPGSSLKTEVRNLAGLGLTPEAALATATTTPGRFWKDAAYGRIAPGMPADIVLYAADPTMSLDGLESLRLVVADGRIYPKATLDGWVERYRRHFRSALYSAVMGWIADRLIGGYSKTEG